MTIEIKRNTLWKQSGNIWHCRKTTISQFFSSSLWLWWDLEAWLGMAWQALALKVALATLMECMWHTRCLGDWAVVKCDEKPLRNHMVQFLQAEGYQQALETCEFWLLFWDWFLHIYIFGIQRRPPFGLPEILLIAPKFQKQSVEACWVICRISNKANRARTFFSFLEVEVKQICFCILHFSTNQNYNDMWIYDSYYSHDSYAFFWPYCWTSSRKTTSKHSITPVVKSTLPRCGNAVVHLGFATCFKMLGLERDGHIGCATYING